MTVIPTPANGGLPVRDSLGNPVTQANVQNGYNPPATFTFDSELNYLPSDCTARITPAQINSFQAEMICLAATLDPNGSWSANTNCNLSAAFSAWDAVNGLADQVTIAGDGVPGDLYRIIPVGTAQALCGSLQARQILAACLLDPDAAQILGIGPNGLIYLTAGMVATALCGDLAAHQTLAACLIDPAADNLVDVGPNALLYVSPLQTAIGICADAAAASTLAACVRSTDAGQTITIGSDGRLLVVGSTDPDVIVASICASATARNALVNCVRSTDPGNLLGLGLDGGLYVTAGPGGGPAPGTPTPADPFPIGGTGVFRNSTGVACSETPIGANNIGGTWGPGPTGGNATTLGPCAATGATFPNCPPGEFIVTACANEIDNGVVTGIVTYYRVG